MTLQQLRNWHANKAAIYRDQAIMAQAKADSGLTLHTHAQCQSTAARCRDLARHHEDAVKLLDSVQS